MCTYDRIILKWIPEAWFDWTCWLLAVMNMVIHQRSHASESWTWLTVTKSHDIHIFVSVPLILMCYFSPFWCIKLLDTQQPIAITKKRSSPVHLTSFSALSWDHLLLIIGNACRSSLQHPPDRSDFWRTDWTKFQTHLEVEIPSNPELHNGMAMDTCVEDICAPL